MDMETTYFDRQLGEGPFKLGDQEKAILKQHFNESLFGIIEAAINKAGKSQVE